MKKTILFTLIIVSLMLVGCIQQTPPENQNLNQNQPAVNQNQNVNQPTANVNQNTNQTNVNINPDTTPPSETRSYQRNIYGLGYSFSYSKNWYYEEKGKIDDDNIDIVVIDNKPVEDYMGIVSFTISNIGHTSLLEKHGHSIGNMTIEDVTIDGVESKRLEGTEMGSGNTVVILSPFPTEPRNTLIIRLNDYDSLDDFEKLLSSFKFAR